jgi:hypothetical protein
LLTAAVVFVSLTIMKRAVSETASASTDALIVPVQTNPNSEVTIHARVRSPNTIPGNSFSIAY